MGADRTGLTGLRFFKMTGSGNDFVFLDGRDPAVASLEAEEFVRAVCDRRNGIGADGVVWLLPGEPGVAFRMRYRNSDGSLAGMCGNAALCSVSLGLRLGLLKPGVPFEFATDAGVLSGRTRGDGLPEITLTPIESLVPIAAPPLEEGEIRMGSANTGVPHLVVQASDAESVDLPRRGRALRLHPSLAPAGANVNFISPRQGGVWRMRTYERGVEAETLACGTGAAACAVLLRAWGLAGAETTLETTSGRRLLVSIHESDGVIIPALAGEGRLVFEGQLD